MATDGGIHHYARGEWHGPSLSHRRIRLQKGLYADFYHFLLLGEGSAELHFDNGEDRPLQGALLAFLPPQPAATFRSPPEMRLIWVGASRRSWSMRSARR